MNRKQLIASALFTCLLVVPKYLFFRLDNFVLDMLLNIACFVIGGTIGALLFMKKPETADGRKEAVKKEEPLPPLPVDTKAEDYNKYMPK
jgi:hypothetical protein